MPQPAAEILRAKGYTNVEPLVEGIGELAQLQFDKVIHCQMDALITDARLITNKCAQRSSMLLTGWLRSKTHTARKTTCV